MKLGMILLCCVLPAGGLVVSGCRLQTDASIARAAPPPRCEGRMAIVIDRTKSFSSNLETASRIITRYISEQSLSGDSQIYLIAIDRKPAVVEYFSASTILDSHGSAILRKMRTPSPYNGTDIVTALELAVMKLRKRIDAQPGKLSLLVFTDGYVDDQPRPSKHFRRLDDFAWGDLKGIETNFYFVATPNEMHLLSLMQRHAVTGTVCDPIESRRLVIKVD